jgi:hypothetical protein
MSRRIYLENKGKECLVEDRNGIHKGILCGYHNKLLIMYITEGPDGWSISPLLKSMFVDKEKNEKGYYFVQEKEIL